MKDRILALANRLDRLGLFEEADMCAEILEQFAKGGDAQGQPYGSIATPMSPLAWLEGDCDHDFGNADQCPACGKMLGEKNG